MKIDVCIGAQDPNISWTRFHEGFDACYAKTGREIVQSVEMCSSLSKCGQWIGSVANLWRTGGDVQNTFGSVMNNIHANDRMRSIAKPGNFNDADMLQVGNVGLTHDEEVAHFSLWAIAGSPLLVGTDIVHIDPAALAILTNKAVIEVNQDLGLDGRLQGYHVSQATGCAASAGSSGCELWLKPMSDGKRIAVILLNLDASSPFDLTFNVTELNVTASAPLSVTDLWISAAAPVIAAGAQYTAKAVPPHGVRMLMFAK